MPNHDTRNVENSGAKPPANTAESASDTDKLAHWSGRRLQFWLFCILLGLALIGMALTQATENGGALYGLILLWFVVIPASLIASWIALESKHLHPASLTTRRRSGGSSLAETGGYRGS